MPGYLRRPHMPTAPPIRPQELQSFGDYLARRFRLGGLPFFLRKLAVPSGSHPRAKPPILLIPFIAILPLCLLPARW